MCAQKWQLMLDAKRHQLRRAALLRDGEVLQFFVQSADSLFEIGDLFYAQVTEERLSAAGWFLDLGNGSSGFLPQAQAKSPETVTKGSLHLVQVTRLPGNGKCVQVTEHLQIVGRAMVYLPSMHRLAVSHALNGSVQTDLRRLAAVWCADNEGIIIRTQAGTMNEQQLHKEWLLLRAKWQELFQRMQTMQRPGLLNRSLSFASTILNDHHWPESCTIHCGYPLEAADWLAGYEVIREESGAVFEQYGLESSYQQATNRRILLKSGASLVIDNGETLTAIDVNSGAQHLQGDWDKHAIQTNCEAAGEIAKQIRQRGIGGMIVIDFLRLKDTADQLEVAQCLARELASRLLTVDCFGFTAMGLFELSRKRQHYSLHDYQRSMINEH
ncbi:MAG: ribonuclease E/G [Sporolactobacillus sp.]